MVTSVLVRTFVLAGCIAAAGCNVVFGLDATELMPAERDNDGDGIVNPDDNCVLVANADQADADEDAFGDACDPCIDSDTQSGLDGDGDGIDDGCDSCLSGRNHDEDSDGIGDGCDVCPGTPDAQADGDGDGIGDLCDADPSVQHRVFFDGFGPPDTAWNTGFKPWKATADGYVPATPAVGSSTYDEGPWHPSGIVLGARLRIAASVMVPPPELLSYEQRVGISLRSFVNGMPLARCEIRVEQTDWVRVSDGSAEVLPPGRVHFELAFVPSSTTQGHSTSTCTIAGKTISSTTLYEIETPYAPSLVANVAAEFEWIDMIE